MNHHFTILVPVEPICQVASVANKEAATQGAELDVIACVCAVAVLLVEETDIVHGVAIAVAKEPVPVPVTAPVSVIV